MESKILRASEIRYFNIKKIDIKYINVIEAQNMLYIDIVSKKSSI